MKIKSPLFNSALLLSLVITLSACASHPPQPPQLTSHVRIPINHCLLPEATLPCEGYPANEGKTQ